jgi:hypothetical protein
MAVTLNASTSSGLVQTADTTGIITLQNNGTNAVTVDSGNLQFNSGYGSVATAYGCRAWVNFNGTTNTGGFCTIRGSGNVTTVADRGTGLYTINFTTAMPDANYCGVASATVGGASNSNRDSAVGPANTSSAYCNSWVADSGSFIDVEVICAAIFR